jgi:hypothetical protein
MLTRRSLFIYNLGVAAIFGLIGLLSIYARDIAQPARFAQIPAFTEASRAAVAEEQNIEQLRERAVSYFTLARDLKRARFEDTDRIYYDAKVLSFAVAGLFMLGALLLLLLPAAAPQRAQDGS